MSSSSSATDREAKLAAAKAEKEAAKAEKAAQLAAAKAEKEAAAAAAKAAKEAAAAMAKAEKEAAVAAAKAEKEARIAEARLSKEAEKATKDEERQAKMAAVAAERAEKAAEKAAIKAAKDDEKKAAATHAALVRSTQCFRKHPLTPFLPGRPLPPGLSASFPMYCGGACKRELEANAAERIGHFRCDACQAIVCFECQPYTEEMAAALMEQADVAAILRQELAAKRVAEQHKLQVDEEKQLLKDLSCRDGHPLTYFPPSSSAAATQEGEKASAFPSSSGASANRSGWFRCFKCHMGGESGNGCHYEDDGYWWCALCAVAKCTRCLPMTRSVEQALVKRDGPSVAGSASAPAAAVAPAPATDGVSCMCPKGHQLSLIAGGVEPRTAIFTCDRCSHSAGNSRWDGYWWCYECSGAVDQWPNVSSYILGKCCLPVPKFTSRCDRQHPLQLIKEGVVGQADESFKCNQCHKREKARAAHWCCHACCYHLCDTCAPIGADDLAAAGPHVTNKAEWIERKVCAHNHPLQRTVRKLGAGPGWERWSCAACDAKGTTDRKSVV